MQPSYFSSLLPALGQRAARSSISKLGFSSPPLRRHLLEVFGRGYGEPGAFLGDPVFEAVFGWKQADTTLDELSESLLHPDLVNAMDKPWGDSAKDYQFPRSARPYVHQLAAWQALLGSGHQSVVVTSGTGSGKTECFMVPVLSSLAAARQRESRVEGIRALFLYPLNALIQSQRERLRAWTGPFDGDIRFCLYNGMTPETPKAENNRSAPNEVHDRATLRQTPPAILVTNPTMLEYLLVRAQDAPILEKSQGKLEWIVLDEAHNYVGSQAAELALLLRRVLHAFGTSAERVRFIATSATIGSGDPSAKLQLQEFLAKLAGVRADRVVVVEGFRQVPVLSAAIDSEVSSTPLAELISVESDDEGRYQRLSTHSMARRLRDLFIPAVSRQNYQTLSAVKSALSADQQPGTDAEALAWLDLLTSAVHGRERAAVPFLPLRLHAFHNTFNGLWACANPTCSAKTSTALDDEAWRFGMVFTEERQHCTCGAPVYPLTSCNDCNETFLSARMVDAGGVSVLLPPQVEDIDDFTLERDPEEVTTRESADEGLEEEEQVEHKGSGTPALIINSQSRGSLIALDPLTRAWQLKPTTTSLALRIQDVDADQVLRCPGCEGDSARSVQFRRPLLGAPFLLGNIIPTLFEFCPDGEVPLNAPMRGRRMITFTDSRQGTARMAAQLQQDAERNAVRSGVYRRLVTASAGPSPERVAIETQIATYKELRQRVVEGPGAVAIDALISEQEGKLAGISKTATIKHHDMVQWLATQSNDVGHWIHRYYADSDASFRGGRGNESLTEILLCREFARRPKRQNSLETMGLVSVQYVGLANVVTRRAAVEQAGLTLPEWRDFLKICLDFYVRQYWALKLPASWDRWGGNRIYSKQILPPGSKEKTTSKLKHWPKVQLSSKGRITKQQSGLVRLLAYVLKVDPMTEVGRDRIDSLFLAAWDDLTMGTNLLQLGSGQSRYLDLADMSFQVITKGWVCPVTRRILDTTLRGVTPYLPPKQVDESVAICRPIDIPVCDVLANTFVDDAAQLSAVKTWLDHQDSLVVARVEGLWSNITDRVVEGAGYFRAVEHSAQQAGSLLEKYEKAFKAGDINLMSCSTTMEMGVDIGGITMVTMNNVPPHPANYLQRAGRAGRRSETRSVALTVCKNNPHDQHVFRHTTWPFATRLPTPGISLSSPLLVQRHVNAMVLSKFLRIQDSTGRLNKLTLEWWMLPRDGQSRQERFVAWCESYSSTKHPDLQNGLTSLVKRTVFEGDKTADTLVSEVGRFSSQHAQQWLLEFNAIEDQISSLSKRDAVDSIPRRALEIQRKRLTAEYLLRELAGSGFLPGYGFPTDITSFETLNKDSAELTKHRDKVSEGREDNRFQRRELPSRDTVTALREYAPGASVVIDGLVYQSAGITLNWHAPATSDQANELQNIRQAWRCRHCGASGTHVLAAKLEHCQECGNALSKEAVAFKPYLEPAGFSVDLYAETHNDVTLQKYIPVESPWIAGNGDWFPLANPVLGRFRSSTNGSVFHYSSGTGKSGYAVCLECGRSAPMGSKDDESGTPDIFSKPHKRLRGRRGEGEDWRCGGSDNAFKIKKAISFGREYTTDVLELTLYDASGNPLVDTTTAYTLAVALRRVVAAKLGVAETEIGCDSKEVRDAQGRRVRVLQLFDVRSAGYSSLVAPELADLLHKARQVLLCEQDCDSTCQSCLLTFDTRFRIDHLNRNKALAFLTPEWLQALTLPVEDQVFGRETTAEYVGVDEALTRELNRSAAQRLLVYLHGDPTDWDLPSSPLRPLLHRLSVKSNVRLALVSGQADLLKLSRENIAILQSLRTVCDLDLLLGAPPATQGPGYCLASVEFADGSCRSWGSAVAEAAQPGLKWGITGDRPLVVCSTDRPALMAGDLTLPTPPGGAGGSRSIEVTRQLDGPGRGFGERFWSLLNQSGFLAKALESQCVTSVSYEDRYLANPISCSLLVEVLSALKVLFERGEGWGDVPISVSTLLIDESKPQRSRNLWVSDWPTTVQRDDALRAAFTYSGMNAHVASKPKYQLLHGRRLVIEFADASPLVVWFDQGLSYWSVSRSDSRLGTALFPMNESPDRLGERMGDIQVAVEGHALPTHIFMDLNP